MRWEDERYVRLYTRDTINWKLLPWQSKCVIPLVMRKLDRAGILDLGGAGLEGVAALIEMPSEVAIPGLETAIARGVFIIANDALVMPHFLEAQENQQTDAQRQRESRERRRSQGLVRTRVGGSDNWVSADTDSTRVTAGHGVTERVTPSRAVPCRAEPAVPNQPTTTESAVGVQERVVPEPEELEPDERGEYRGNAWGFWGWHNHERQRASLHPEPKPPERFLDWYGDAVARVGIAGLTRSYPGYLADPDIRARGHPFSVFMTEDVWLPRANEPPPKKRAWL